MPRTLSAEQQQMFRDLADSTDPADRLKAAKSLRCPPPILVELTRDSSLYGEISRKAWANPNLPVETMREGAKLITSRQSRLTWGTLGLCRNKNLPSEVCVALSFRVNSIYEHPNFPISVMRRHYEHARIDVKKSMAKNKNLSQEMQTLLAQDKVVVKRSLAKNKHISEETVDILASCDSAPVLRRIIDHPLAVKHREAILQKLASPEVFQGIHTTAAIARHTNDDEFIGNILETTDHPLIQKSVFTNASLNETIVEDACYSDNKEIRTLAAKHPRCPETGKVAVALQS